jgi:hypothetical protein
MVVNNYFLINIGRFKVSTIFYKRNVLDFGIEVALLYLYIAVELICKVAQAYPKKLHNIKNVLKINQSRNKVIGEFDRLLSAIFSILGLAGIIVAQFYFIHKKFKISFVNISLPVGLVVPDSFLEILH